MSDFLDEALLKSALSGCSFVNKIVAFREIDSTNDYLKKLCIDESPPEGTLVYAEKQIRGRGRYGRKWDSPKGNGLWFSCLFRPQSSCRGELEWTRMGVSACQRAVYDLFGIRPDIKWPNDLYIDDKKLGGVLTEPALRGDTIQRVLMGIGMNVNQTEQDFHPSIQNRAISLKMALNREIDRLRVLVQIIRMLEKDYLHASG